MPAISPSTITSAVRSFHSTTVPTRLPSASTIGLAINAKGELADLDLGLVGRTQARQHVALVRRILVEYVDVGTDQLACVELRQ